MAREGGMRLKEMFMGCRSRREMALDKIDW